MEADWALEDFYTAIWQMHCSGKNIIAILPALVLLTIEFINGDKPKRAAKITVNTLMFLAGIWPYCFGGDFKILLFMLPMILVFISSQNCGRYIGGQVYEKVTIFAENKCRRKPPETLEDSENLNKYV